MQIPVVLGHRKGMERGTFELEMFEVFSRKIRSEVSPATERLPCSWLKSACWMLDARLRGEARARALQPSTVSQ